MPLAEVRVLVPEKRVGEFYSLVGAWLRGEASPKRTLAEQSLSPKSRYAMLNQHLAAIDAEKQTLSLGFDEIGKILGKPLPRSAYDHRAWWANTHSHAQALAWLTAGWKIDHVDLPSETVRFVRPQ